MRTKLPPAAHRQEVQEVVALSRKWCLTRDRDLFGAEQSTDAAFRARGILPAVFTTSGEGTRGFIRTLYDKNSDVYMMSIRFYMVLIFCLLFNTYCFKCDLKYDAVFCFTYVRTYMICYTYDRSF